jgi:hypothetical protein
VHYHHVRHTDNAGDWRDVANEIEIELLVQRGVDCIRRSGQEERIAVRRRARDRLGGDVAAGAWPVLNNELLTEPLREPLSYQTRDDVTRTAGAIADEDAYRSRRIGLCARDGRHDGQRGSARGQMQKWSAGKFHFEPPSLVSLFDHLIRAPVER